MKRIQYRIADASEFAAWDPLLARDEIGIERDTGMQKIGDGISVWSELSYGAVGPQGPQGEQGPQGATGATGPGVAAGGATGQVLRKASATDYDTSWFSGFPATSTDNAVARFDGTSGKLQDSSVTVDDAGQLNANRVSVWGTATDDPIVTVRSQDGRSPFLTLESVGAQDCYFGWKRGDVTRFYFRVTQDTFAIRSADDTGSIWGSAPYGEVFSIDRTNGTVRLGGHTSGEYRAGLEFGSSGPRMMMGTGGPSGIAAPVGSTWRQTDANSSHGNLVGLLWNKVGSGTAEGTDWLVDYEGRWLSETPTVTGWTKGSGTVTSYWTRTGREVRWRTLFTLNSTTVSGSLTLTLPVTPAAYSVGEGVLVDNGSGSYMAMVRLLDTGLAYISAIGTNGAFLSPTSTVPFTWANTDYVVASATYRIA